MASLMSIPDAIKLRRVLGMTLKRTELISFWIKTSDPHGPLGFGVTAWSVEDAIDLIRLAGYSIDLFSSERRSADRGQKWHGLYSDFIVVAGIRKYICQHRTHLYVTVEYFEIAGELVK